jgi:hypothetical protein
MNDDLERNLDGLYRDFDGPARKLERRWQGGTRKMSPVRPPSIGPWIAAGVAAAAVIALVLGLRMRDTTPTAPTVVRKEPKRPEEPTPPKPEEPKRPEPKPEEPKPEPPKTEEPKKPEPKPEEPKRPEPEPPKPEEPKKPEPEPAPAPTKPEEPAPAITLFKESEGSFELSGRKVTGKQKELKVVAGDTLKATTVAKLTLAENRFILLSPKTQVVFSAGERLVVTIDHGDVVAVLVGPGPAVRFATKACEVDHVGTVFAMKVDERRTVVWVEEGKVECRNSKGSMSLGAGQQAIATSEAAPAAPAAQFPIAAWAKGHRPAERARFVEDFLKPGAWKADVANGVAKGVPDPEWCAGKLQLEGESLFTVPLKGRIVVVCKADRAALLVVQVHCDDPKMNFRKELQITRGNAWQTIAVDFDDMVPTDKSVKAKLPAGATISEIYLMYGEAKEKGTIWVDGVSVIEVRP